MGLPVHPKVELFVLTQHRFVPLGGLGGEDAGGISHCTEYTIVIPEV